MSRSRDCSNASEHSQTFPSIDRWEGVKLGDRYYDIHFDSQDNPEELEVVIYPIYERSDGKLYTDAVQSLASLKVPSNEYKLRKAIEDLKTNK